MGVGGEEEGDARRVGAGGGGADDTIQCSP